MVQRSRAQGTLVAALSIAVLAVALAGCSTTTKQVSSATQADEPAAATSAAGEKSIVVEYPVIAPIRLPDTSMLNAGASTMAKGLSTLKQNDDAGLDIVSPSCDAKGNLTTSAPDLFKLTEVQDYLNLDGGAHVEVTTDKDGTKHYLDLGGNKHLELVVHKDGSGELVDLGGTRHLEIQVAKDGSGELTDLGGKEHLSITVNKDGSGSYLDLGGTRHLEIEVEADGTGHLVDLGDDKHLEITLEAGGKAAMTDLGGPAHLEVEVGGDGSGHFVDLGGDAHVELTVTSDGSLTLNDQGGPKRIELSVAADRTGHYADGSNDIAFDFDSEGRATDGSGYVITLPETPAFFAPDRFPPLGKLGRLSPPCATVLRFAADALFDFDKATLKPASKELIAKAAAVLVEAGKPIEVEGHTDAKGSDDYNQDLSERRATAFAEALKAQAPGLTDHHEGLGRDPPGGAQHEADGKDNPGGRALNRRVEVVLKN